MCIQSKFSSLSIEILSQNRYNSRQVETAQFGLSRAWIGRGGAQTFADSFIKVNIPGSSLDARDYPANAWNGQRFLEWDRNLPSEKKLIEKSSWSLLRRKVSSRRVQEWNQIRQPMIDEDDSPLGTNEKRTRPIIDASEHVATKYVLEL